MSQFLPPCRIQRRRGAIIPFAAVLIAVVLAFVALAIDVGIMVVANAHLQNAADSAALAGALHLRDGAAGARQRARDTAAANEVAGDAVVINNSDIELGLWDPDTATFALLTGSDEDDANAVRVTCQRIVAHSNPIRLFFAHVVGRDTADMSASAIALAQGSTCGLIIGLDEVNMSGSSHTDSFNSENGPYNPATARSNGHVCSNGEIKMSGSTAINGNGHPGPGHIVNSSSSIGVLGSTVPLTRPITMPPVDPGDAAFNNDNDLIPLSAGGEDPFDGSKFSLSGGDAVDLPPGTYYFGEVSLSGGSLIRISGPTTIYVTGKASLSGGSVANLTLRPKNFKLNVMGSDCKISGDSAFYGQVYAPTAKVERSGDSDYHGSIVGGKLTLSGSGGIHADESLAADMSNGGRAFIVE